MRLSIAIGFFVVLTTLSLVLVFSHKNAFEKNQARAEARNPRGLKITLDTLDGRHTYKESDDIQVVLKYSSAIRYQYKIEAAEGMSKAMFTEVVHLDDGTNAYTRMGVACCDSRLIGLDDNPYVSKIPIMFRLPPGKHQIYSTNRRVFPWSTNSEYEASPWVTASNLLTLKILPDPGWQERRLASIKQSLASGQSSACWELSQLDSPAATAEKLNQVKAGASCGKGMIFQHSEYATVAPILEQLAKDPQRGVTWFDLDKLVSMNALLAHPELQFPPADPDEESAFQTHYRAAYHDSLKTLVEMLCATLPQKQPAAREVTAHALEGLSPFHDTHDISCPLLHEHPAH